MTTATFIKKPKRLRRLREGPLGVHIDRFSARLLKGVLPAGVRDWRRPGLIAFLPRLIRAIGGTYGQHEYSG